MADTINTTSTISNRTCAHAATQMLVRALPYLVLEKFGQTYVLPTNSTKVVKFRRFEALDATPQVLVEATTPPAKALVPTDVTATVSQYGDRVIISDMVMDTNEDPVLKSAVEVLGEQAAQMIENVRVGVLNATTNVVYSDTASAPGGVAKPIVLGDVRKVLRKMRAQMARPITSIVRSTPSFDTKNIQPSYVWIVHPSMEADIRSIPGFKDAVDYGQQSAWENEIGSVEGIRFIWTTLMPVSPDTGAAPTGVESTTGTKADVYTSFVIARDSYGIVPLKGANALTPIVVNPNPSDSDPLGQRGHVGWKTCQTAVILNSAWLIKFMCAVTKY